MSVDQLLQEICENNGIYYMHSSWGKSSTIIMTINSFNTIINNYLTKH